MNTEDTLLDIEDLHVSFLPPLAKSRLLQA